MTEPRCFVAAQYVRATIDLDPVVVNDEPELNL